MRLPGDKLPDLGGDANATIFNILIFFFNVSNSVNVVQSQT